MELEYQKQQKEKIEQEEYLEKLKEKFKRLKNDIEFNKKYKFEIFNNRIRYLKLDSLSKVPRWKFLCDEFDCQKKSIKKLCTYHQKLLDSTIPIEFLNKLQEKLKKCIYAESLKQSVKYKYHIFNDKIIQTLISNGSTKSLCYDLECTKTLRGHKKYCNYHARILGKANEIRLDKYIPGIYNKKTKKSIIKLVYINTITDKLNKLIYIENLKKNPEYKFEIYDNNIKKINLNNNNFTIICDNLECENDKLYNNNFCILHKNLNDKLLKLQNEEKQLSEIKYNYKIFGNKIKKLFINSIMKENKWITICNEINCKSDAKNKKNYCRYHQRILIDKPIPKELQEELKDLQDINLNPEFKDIQFKINCHHINGDIYRILKKTINSNTFIPICLHKYCINCCNFNFEGETTRLYCGEHKLVGMVNLDSRKCINILDDGTRCKIGISDNKKYDGYCINCYYNLPENKDKIRILNRGVKESYVVDFIKSNYDNKEIKEKYNIIDIIYDKYCGTTKKKPDIVFICTDNVIVLEIDENQHKGHSYDGGLYSKENEEKKMELIREHYQKKDKKTIYLRFNPDDYKTKNNKKIKSPWSLDEDKKLIVIDENDWNNRLKILKQKVDFYLKKKEIKNNSTIYLFYDD